MRGDRSANACNRHRCTRHKHTGQLGFSLIEILIAMTVTIIGLAGLLSLHLTAARGNSRATRTVMASVIAQQTMDELRSMPVQPPTAGYTEDTLQTRFGGIPANDVALAAVQGPDNTSYQRFVSVRPLGPAGSPLGNVVLVRVVIAWTDEGAAANTTNTRLRHRMVLESMRTRQDVL